VLVMITLAFVAVGVNNVNTIYSALRDLFSAQEEASSRSISGDDFRTFTSARNRGKKLLKRVFLTVLLVFSTFLVRSVFTILYAVAQAFPDNQQPNVCVSTSGCDLCRGVYSHIQTFILFEPAFQNIVILLASPLTLVVALWGMSLDSAAPETSDQL
jgi:lipopolysaccharide/colanic/teichoic acid biosynthesis glycosyltransferase